MSMTSCDLDTSVPDWIIEHPETLAVFHELGIDYCCGGKSLEFACRERGHSVSTVMSKLLCLIEASRNSDSSPTNRIPISENQAMSIQHAQAGEVIQLALGSFLGGSKTTTLVKTAQMELIRLVLPAGKEIPLHKAPGEITVQCLEGRIAFTSSGTTQELTSGQLLYLAAGEPHAVKGIEDSSLLVTILIGKK